MPKLGAAPIGTKPKQPARLIGLGQTGGYALPVPRPVDANLTSRYSPIVQRGNTTIAERTGQVQGKKASDLEERVYTQLRKLGWTDASIQFQVGILGGRRPGGQVLDFVLYGPGYVYVIAVNGDYWHAVGRKAEVTRMNENITRWIMPSARVISLFNADLLTDEIALATLRRLVGRGQ